MKIEKATAKDSHQMAETLAQAFDKDPVTNYTLRQDHRRKQAFRDMFRMVIKIMRKNDELYVTEDLEGVALWDPPEKWGLSFFQEIYYLPSFLRNSGLSRLANVNKVVNATKKVHPSTPHMYLFAIGIMPDQSRKGIGSKLMRHMLDRCDRERLPAYLENTNEINMAFYMNHGFQVTSEIKAAPDAPMIWTMWRDPK